MGMNEAMNKTIINVINKYAKEYGVNPQLAIDIATAESTLDPKATGKLGEVGLFQLHPKYIPEYAKHIGITPEQMKTFDPYDVNNNARMAVSKIAHLKKSLAKYPDDAYTIAAYNWGIGNLKKNKYQIPDKFKYHPNKIYRSYYDSYFNKGKKASK